MAPVLETVGLTKTFGAVIAASNISLRFEQDSIVGMIGGNGAGKTTFLNLITGYLRPTFGTILHQGRDITSLSPRKVTRLGICRSFQIPQLFGTLTARENLLVGTGIAGRSSAANEKSGRAVDQRADEALARFGLVRYRDLRCDSLPEGVRKLLDIALAVILSPRVLLLDEPTSGVSAEEKFDLMDVVFQAIQGAGVSVLFVEHDIDVVRRYARRVLAFYEGRIIADGAPDSVLRDPQVRKFVVGEETPPSPGGERASD